MFSRKSFPSPEHQKYFILLLAKLISRCTWNPFLLHLLCGGGLLKGALPFPAVAEAEASSDPKEAP